MSKVCDATLATSHPEISLCVSGRFALGQTSAMSLLDSLVDRKYTLTQA